MTKMVMKRSVEILVILSLFLGCISSPPQTTTHKNENGFSDLNEKLACLPPHDMPEEVIINSQEEYNDLLRYRSDSPGCTDFVLPYIDFSQNTLLGKYASGVGCSITFEKHVYRDEANKKIVYSVTVIEDGNCEMFGMSMNWIIVSKIPPEYVVIFEVNKE